MLRATPKPARSRAAELLFGAYRRQLLSLLLLRPAESFYAREIERLTSIPVGSLHRELKLLTEAGLVRRTESGGQIRYQADQSCAIFGELASIFRRSVPTTPGQNAYLIAAEPAAPPYQAIRTIEPPRRSRTKKNSTPRPSALSKLKVSQETLAEFCRQHGIRKLSFFGSVVRDDFRPDSDVDVMVEFESGKVPGLFGIVDLQDEFSTLFKGRKVDVTSPRVLQNPHRRRTIERDLQVAYEAS